MDALGDPNFREYSGLELRAAVKRLVCGPETWADASSPPTIRLQLPIEFSPIKPGPYQEYQPRVKMLPGGRYFTIGHRDGRLECWCLATGGCVWTHAGRRAEYAVEVLNGGDSARFLLDASPDE